MVKFALILLLPMTCLTKIHLDIETASSVNEMNISFGGDDSKLVSNEEIILYNVSNDNLKLGIKVEMGKAPDDVFIKDPTPYGNLYAKYQWNEVKRRLTVNKVKIIDVINEKVVLKVHKFINNTTNIINSSLDVFQYVENTVSSTWREEGLPNEEIFYDVTVIFDGRRFQYENKWRNNTFRSVFLPFGKKRDGYVNINPGQTIVKKLEAMRTVIYLEIDYVAVLNGDIVANYAHVYGNYHFWSPSVVNVMKSAGLVNEIHTRELIQVKCYTDARLQIFDKTTGRNLNIIRPESPFRIFYKHFQRTRN